MTYISVCLSFLAGLMSYQQVGHWAHHRQEGTGLRWGDPGPGASGPCGRCGSDGPSDPDPPIPRRHRQGSPGGPVETFGWQLNWEYIGIISWLPAYFGNFWTISCPQPSYVLIFTLHWSASEVWRESRWNQEICSTWTWGFKTSQAYLIFITGGAPVNFFDQCKFLQI